MLKASLLSIGDEILIGQIVNTNSVFIAKELTNLGYSIHRISTIGDSRQEIIDELDSLFKVSDLIICTGGLGPTHDDITKDVICEYFDDVLVHHQQWEDKIRDQFKVRGLPLSDRNKGQALLPSKSKLLFNRIGTAPGMLIEKDNKFLISLPGVPNEAQCIIKESAMDFLKGLIDKTDSDCIIYKNILTNGIPESSLADKLDISEAILGKSSLAFLPSYQGVKLRIGAYGINKSKAEQELSRLYDYIFNRCSENIISEDEISLMEVLAELLINNKVSISTAESCTGGLLSSMLTSVPGSSKYMMGSIVSYSNDVKENLLKVKKETLINFGAVSKETAIEMAENCRKIFNTDYSISITGIAGPDGGTNQKPVGTVWIGLSTKTGTGAFLSNLGNNDRTMNRERAVTSALALLIREIKKPLL
jgi:nicotinamide-nucleotide amidase